MSHSPHPDIHEYGLADDCESCADLAKRPWSLLDERAFRDLMERMLSNRFDGYGERCHPRSTTEALAMASVLTVLERAGKVAELCPDLFVRYIRDHWQVPLGVVGWVVPEPLEPSDDRSGS